MPKILIADDNPQNAELIEAHLDGAGFETKIAEHGEATLTMAASWKPDIVLLDIMMPKLSGFEVCKRLKAQPDGPAIIMVTALDQSSDVDRAVEAGTDDFLSKPINKAELILRVKAMLAAKKHPSPVERTLAYIRSVQAGPSGVTG